MYYDSKMILTFASSGILLHSTTAEVIEYYQSHTPGLASTHEVDSAG